MCSSDLLVEEPPPHVRFIFATTEVEKVLPTIRSRTHNYTFRLVSSKELQQHLAAVCEREGVPAEPAALAARLRQEGTATVTAAEVGTVEIGPDDVIVSETPREGWSVSSGEGETVALDLEITPQLRSLGTAREAIRLIRGSGADQYRTTE